MKLGIDFGTTRIVVAAADRGNYPVVSFETPEGETRDWFPPLVALRGRERRFGWEAWAKQADPNWVMVRSLKRETELAGLETRLDLDGDDVSLMALLTGLAGSLQRALREMSNLPLKKDEPLEVLLGVPANANSNQRFLTVEAFRRAGFEVQGMLNEPSAASIEFAHRYEKERGGEAERLLVYDLGGGTFDASIVEIADDGNRVLSTAGIPRFGGDDFDEILAKLALEPERRDSLTIAERFRLLEECRERKEAIKPATKRIAVDLEVVRPGWGTVNVPIALFEGECRPLVEESVAVVQQLVLGLGSPKALEALYVTGGGSELPLVARVLRETFGRQVKRSAHTRAATAIGLAIQADAAAGYRLKEKFGRAFGVWRERDAGRAAWFDVIFENGTELPMPAEPPLVRERRYYPVHNVGHFRYLEAGGVNREGQPSGELVFWDEIRFPFAPELAAMSDLSTVAVQHAVSAQTQEIVERFSCDANGIVHVELRNVTSGYGRVYDLARWSVTPATKPVRPRRARTAVKPA